MRPGGGRLSPRIDRVTDRLQAASICLGEAVFGGAAPLDGAAWTAWIAHGRTAAARLAAKLVIEGLAGYGASAVMPMPRLDGRILEARLAADADGSFAARPDWQGEVFATGPLARRADHPLVGGLIAEYGRGLVAHLAARVVEMAGLAREMRDFAVRLCDDNGSQLKTSAGRGLGMVEAARGCLVHRVEVVESKVARYQILAPTEWNFHPLGPLVRGLGGRPAGNDPAARARLLIGALDPCVTCTVEVQDA